MKRKSSPASSEEDFKPTLSEEAVKPSVSKKAKPQKGKYAPGGKQALAELIIELGVKALPPNKEVAKIVSSAEFFRPKADPRPASRRRRSRRSWTPALASAAT